MPRILLIGLLAATLLSPRSNQEPIILRLLPQPGTVEIVNTTGTDLSIRGRLIVERKREGAWITTPVVFQAIESCDGHDAPDCVKLPPSGKIVPVKWDGHTCSGQCTRSCRSNHYNGPGEFRFVVETCDKAHKFFGEPFRLGAEVASRQN